MEAKLDQSALPKHVEKKPHFLKRMIKKLLPIIFTEQLICGVTLRLKEEHYMIPQTK
jgi:hypothetical protein